MANCGKRKKTTVVEPSAKAKEKKSLIEHWQVWTGIIIATLTILTTLLELPDKLGKFVASITSQDSTQSITQLEWQTLEGQIVDEDNNPLIDVIVMLPEYNLADTTNFAGRFQFIVQTSHQAPVRLQARKLDYETLYKDPPVGVDFLLYTMRRLK